MQSPALRPARIVNESATVHLYGAVAVVNGVCRESGIKNGRPYALRERFTDTWVRRSDSWVCVQPIDFGNTLRICDSLREFLKAR